MVSTLQSTQAVMEGFPLSAFESKAVYHLQRDGQEEHSYILTVTLDKNQHLQMLHICIYFLIFLLSTLTPLSVSTICS